jgi:hypothetical protein
MHPTRSTCRRTFSVVCDVYEVTPTDGAPRDMLKRNSEYTPRCSVRIRPKESTQDLGGRGIRGGVEQPDDREFAGSQSLKISFSLPRLPVPEVEDR